MRLSAGAGGGSRRWMACSGPSGANWRMRAEAAVTGPWRQQAILGRGRWEDDALRDVVREYVVES